VVEEEGRFRRALAVSSLAQTLEVAAEVGAALEGGEVLALIGPLGSGKTTFAKGLCRGLGVLDSRSVSSPTYVLEHVYLARLAVHHFDVYRLGSADEFAALGFEEHIKARGVLLIEWADKVLDLLPESTLRVELSVPEAPLGKDTRKISFSGPSAAWLKKLGSLFCKVPAASER
jgi:tRNA threonylcarbamoyladenosine biosynthesis protein TsaE